MEKHNRTCTLRWRMKKEMVSTQANMQCKEIKEKVKK
jgi:hypothetical protein